MRQELPALELQVLEWWAYLADVLSFYNERYANESYLGTATQPGNIANLAALLGYQPSPGIALHDHGSREHSGSAGVTLFAEG